MILKSTFDIVNLSLKSTFDIIKKRSNKTSLSLALKIYQK